MISFVFWVVVLFVCCGVIVFFLFFCGGCSVVFLCYYCIGPNKALFEYSLNATFVPALLKETLTWINRRRQVQTHKERSLDFLCKNLVRRCCAFCCSEAVNITGFLQQGGVVGNKSNAHIPRMFCPRIQLLRCMTNATLTSVYTNEYLFFQRITQWLTDPHVRGSDGCVLCAMFYGQHTYVYVLWHSKFNCPGIQNVSLLWKRMLTTNRQMWNVNIRSYNAKLIFTENKSMISFPQGREGDLFDVSEQ